MSDGESDGAAPHAAGDEEAAIEATEDWVVERCGVEDITAWTQLALPGYTTAYPKLRGLGTALISFAGLTLFLAPGLRLGARWNRLGQAVKTRKKR